MLALEDDGITASARRRISDRIAELEQEIGNHQASLGKLRVELDATPPDAPTVADVPDRLPVFGDRLQEFSQPRLRRLFDSLDLMITYDPVRHAARVRITLATDAGGLRGSGRCAQLYTILRTPRHRQHPWSTPLVNTPGQRPDHPAAGPARQGATRRLPERLDSDDGPQRFVSQSVSAAEASIAIAVPPRSEFLEFPGRTRLTDLRVENGAGTVKDGA